MILHCMALLLSSVIASTSPLHQDEITTIGEPIRLTDPTMFLKAGESYFDPKTDTLTYVQYGNADAFENIDFAN